MSNNTISKPDTLNWEYAEKDRNAMAEMRRRIEAKARKERFITYSDLVRGVVFNYPNVNQGKPYRINTDSWTGLDRLILRDNLCYISAESYNVNQFMLSALAISRFDCIPSDYFFKQAEILGILHKPKNETKQSFWIEQAKKVHLWYKKSR